VKIPLEVSLPLHFAVLSLQSVPIPAVSFQGCSPEDCAPFCAPPASKSVALGSNGKGKQITRTSAENQHHSKLSHSVGKMYAATVNRRVATSEQDGNCLHVSVERIQTMRESASAQWRN
jgi:hypothetical protein